MPVSTYFVDYVPMTAGGYEIVLAVDTETGFESTAPDLSSAHDVARRIAAEVSRSYGGEPYNLVQMLDGNPTAYAEAAAALGLRE